MIDEWAVILAGWLLALYAAGIIADYLSAPR